jgi:hypothetical protein
MNLEALQRACEQGWNKAQERTGRTPDESIPTSWKTISCLSDTLAAAGAPAEVHDWQALFNRYSWSHHLDMHKPDAGELTRVLSVNLAHDAKKVTENLANRRERGLGYRYRADPEVQFPITVAELIEHWIRDAIVREGVKVRKGSKKWKDAEEKLRPEAEKRAREIICADWEKDLADVKRGWGKRGHGAMTDYQRAQPANEFVSERRNATSFRARARELSYLSPDDPAIPEAHEVAEKIRAAAKRMVESFSYAKKSASEPIRRFCLEPR